MVMSAWKFRLQLLKVDKQLDNHLAIARQHLRLRIYSQEGPVIYCGKLTIGHIFLF